jgi:hypothetical protein
MTYTPPIAEYTKSEYAAQYVETKNYLAEHFALCWKEIWYEQ